jgi:hypothetical protein
MAAAGQGAPPGYRHHRPIKTSIRREDAKSRPNRRLHGERREMEKRRTDIVLPYTHNCAGVEWIGDGASYRGPAAT